MLYFSFSHAGIQCHNESVGDHGTGRKRWKVGSDQEDHDVHADQAKRKQNNIEADNIGGHPSVSSSMSFDPEAIEDDNNFRSSDINEMKKDQSSKKESYKFIDSQAVEDNDHLEFEEDFVGENSEEEAYDRTDKNVQRSDGDASDDSGGHPSMNLSMSLDSEVKKEDNNFRSSDINDMEEDHSPEEESFQLIDSQAVEDNANLEFEVDFVGEDSDEERYRVDTTDEDVQGSDSETDASDGNESEYSFVVNDDSVEYTQENDSLDQLDEAAEMVSKRRGTYYCGVHMPA